MTDPILDGVRYHRCGPNFNNARCSIVPTDWTVRQPANGPCCSLNSYCGNTAEHCNNGIDFREVISDDTWEVKPDMYLPTLIPPALHNLNAAQRACLNNAKCHGITKVVQDRYHITYELRAGDKFGASPTGEISWRKKIK